MVRAWPALLLAVPSDAQVFHAPSVLGAPVTLPPAPTLAPYNCKIGIKSLWPQTQKDWCCEHQNIACDTTTTIEEVTTPTTAKTTTEKKTTSTEAPTTAPTTLKATTTTKPETTSTRTTTLKTTTTLPTTSTKTTTTHPSTCNSPCEVNGIRSTCREQIQQASLSDFLGNPRACYVAQEVISAQCDICSYCSPEEAGCGTLEPITTPAPSTTKFIGQPCDAVCTLGGQPATCSARIMWSVEHLFQGKPQACKQAHTMVLKQCEICGQCQVEYTNCEEQAPPDVQEIFDCQSGAAVEWSEAKQVWCCEHHQQACDLMHNGDHDVFFQRKAAEGDSVLGRLLSRATISGVCITGVTLVAVIGVSIRTIPSWLSRLNGPRDTEVFLNAVGPE